MAMLEKTCPAIWNRLMMNVPWNMVRDGFLMPQPGVVPTLPRRPRLAAGPLIPPRRSRAARMTTQ